jgi:hypothetical protein
MSVQHHRGHGRFDMFGLEMPFAESRTDAPARPGPRAWQAEGYQAENPPAKAEDPPGLEDMLRLPGRFDDPKRDPAVDKDGTRFSSFLRGRNRREFARDWLAKTPRLAEARSAPQADLADGDIAKAWFVIHDVGVKSSLADMRYKANQAATKKSSVHGFLNRAGYFAATHDFAKNKMGTVYEFLSVKGKKVAGGKTINIETVPDIENGAAIGRDGKPAPPANADRYASIGYRNAHGGKKVNYYKWTHAAFETLADLYILASARAGHLLTITAHKEMDRNLGRSVIWREYKAKQLRETTNKYLVKARDRPSDYHGDPYAFDIQALYEVITRKLNAFGGEQMPKGARYGVHPLRLRKANGLDIGNGSGQLHEFPHQSDPQVKADTGLKKPGWWLAGTKAEAEHESESEDPWERERFEPEWSGEDEERSGEEESLADTHDFEDEDVEAAMGEESLDGEEPEWSGETTVPWGESALHDETGEESLAWLDFEDPLISAFEGDGESPQYEASPRAARAPAAKPMLGGMVWTAMHRPTWTKVTTFVTPRALKQEQVEVLFYVHGLLGPCGRPSHGMESLIASKMFRLAANAVASGRPIILVVPQFQDGNDASWRSRGLGQPSALNRIIAATLLEVSRRTATAVPQASALIVAGHSRAYGVLFELAGAHASSAMAEGALARLSEIWALDASYGSFPHQAFDALLAAKPALKASVVYRAGSPTDKFKGKAATGRLALVPVSAQAVSHCAVPAHAMPKLLAGEPVEGRHAKKGEFESGWHEILEESDRQSWVEALDTSSEVQSDEAEFEGEAFGFHDTELDEGELESEEEDVIANAGLTPAERKALEITSTLETGKPGGFFGLTGNDDKQGLSFGLVNWTIGTGSLQPLLRAFFKAHPQRWASIFGAHAASFRDLIADQSKDSTKRQLAFAVEHMNERYTLKGKSGWRIREPWHGYFSKLADDTAFQKIQVRFVRPLLAKADEYCRNFGLTSERAFAYMFDAVSSHGMWWLTTKKFGGRPKRQILLNASIEQIKLRHGGSVPEDELLLAIADVLAATSLVRYRDRVRARKRWFVTGQHPRAKELRGLEPSPDVRYAFGGAAQELEDEDQASDEADFPSAVMEELEVEDEHKHGHEHDEDEHDEYEHDEYEMDEALEGLADFGRQEMEGGDVKPVLVLESFVARKDAVAFASVGTDRYQAATCTTFSPPAMFVEVRGRLRLTEAGTARAFRKEDRKAFARLSAVARARPVNGVSASSGQVSPVKDDGGFTCPVHVVLDPGTWRLSFQITLEWRGGKIAADAIATSSELVCFTQLVAPHENAKPATQSGLEFLASVRKMYQPSPDSSLAGLFPLVLDKTRQVKPLFEKNSTGGMAYRRYEQGMKIRGEDVDIGHVLVGIEAHRRQGPGASGMPVAWAPSRIETLMTWGGDLGGVLAYVARQKPMLKATSADIPRLLAAKASFADLRGDLDGINIGAVYDPGLSLARNLRSYYEAPSFRRFHGFIANALDDDGKPMFRLTSGKPARVDLSGSKVVADWIGFFARAYLVFNNHFSMTDSEVKVAHAVIEPGSKESNAIIAYFFDLLNKGLASET